MDQITKVYPNGVKANDNISLHVNRGEIHALMGENGAGKSTLMKILFGLEDSDQGTIEYKGQVIKLSSPAQAIDLGIGMVNQHFMLVDQLNVYENVILGMEPHKGIFIDRDKSIALVEEYANKFNLKVQPKDVVENLSVSQKQKVELLKVLTRGSELIILDEPTAVLTPQETSELFQQLRLLKDSGYTIIFITHKIKEVMDLCDRITILRKGKTVDTIDVLGATPEQISKLMVGRDVLLEVDKEDVSPGEVTLEVSSLSAYNDQGIKKVDDVSLQVKKNQIVGIAGVEGNGQTELADALFGILPIDRGTIHFQGQDITGYKIAKRRQIGLGYIPEDRIDTGAAVNLSLAENLIADKIDKKYRSKFGFLLGGKIKEAANQLIADYNIVSLNSDQSMQMLSGGNMQKIVVAREISSDPNILIANQPTRGIDVGAQEFIWKELINFRDKGKGVLLISADLNELLELSDRVLVMLKGKIVAELSNSPKISEEELGLYMLGVKDQLEGREPVEK